MKFPNQYRFQGQGMWATRDGQPFGWFYIPSRATGGRAVKVCAVDGEETGWEHVSVSLDGSDKCPSWQEMCAVKALFWEPTECVVQFHPPDAAHINIHPGCLHLWRCVNAEFPTPPQILV
jgi:hypothetical protein